MSRSAEYGVSSDLYLQVEWHESYDDNYYRISPELFRWDRNETSNYGGHYRETLYLPSSQPYTWDWQAWNYSSGGSYDSQDTFSTYSYQRKDVDYDIYLTIEWDSSTGTYNGGFNYVDSGSHDFWITIPKKDIKTYNITCKSNNKIILTSQVNIGQSFTLPSTPSAPDQNFYYTFNGWQINGAGQIYKPGERVTITEDTVFIANWTKKWKVIFYGKLKDGTDYSSYELSNGRAAGSTIDCSFVTPNLFNSEYKSRTDSEKWSTIIFKDTLFANNKTIEITKTQNLSYTIDEWKYNNNKIDTYVIKESDSSPIKIYGTIIKGITGPLYYPETITVSPLYGYINSYKNESLSTTNTLKKEDSSYYIYYNDKKIATSEEIVQSQKITDVYEVQYEQKCGWVNNKDTHDIIENKLLKSLDYSATKQSITYEYKAYGEVTPTGTKTLIKEGEEGYGHIEGNLITTGVKFSTITTPQKDGYSFNGIFNYKKADGTTVSFTQEDILNGLIFDIEDFNEDKKLILEQDSNNDFSQRTFSPILTNMNFYRCNSDGTPNDEGTEILVSGKLTQSQSVINNEDTVTCVIKVDGVSGNKTAKFLNNALKPMSKTPQDFSVLTSSDSFFQTDEQYYVTLTLSCDQWNNAMVSASDYISKSFFTMDFLAGGTGIAIGAPSSSSGFINSMETGFFNGFAVYPKQYGDIELTTGGRNLWKDNQEHTITRIGQSMATTTAIANVKGLPAGIYSLSSDRPNYIYFYVEGYENQRPEDEKNDQEINNVKGSRKVTIKLKGTEETITVKTLPYTNPTLVINFKLEAGPSCSSWTPTPEDAATLLIDNSGLIKVNSIIQGNITNAENANNAKKIINDDETLFSLGSETSPVYFKNGIPVSCTSYANATVAIANKLGTSTIGNSTQPFYLKDGIPMACTSYADATVNKAKSLNLSSAVGNINTPVYFNVSGSPIACTMPTIVASGTNDFWYYRMWSNGIAECWGTTGSTTVNFYAKQESSLLIYESSAIIDGKDVASGHKNYLPYDRDEWPFNVTIDGTTYDHLFFEEPDYFAWDFLCSSKDSFWKGATLWSTKVTELTPEVRLIKINYGSITGRYMYYLAGRWKKQ